ncbi:OLC1v1007452C1 [Oldenlandia corymbosa var. corymbosa]|uniref:OLC1v1007452C1 n=1 Tax=Oldenlandia corymbosa var. corymbosa TaxID=529605 RepID=A0AAV1DKR8_OLDCO|nr:OLC1v1007452C1 [Oldenlandia corymbosa var. corymbosa]
MTGIGALVCDAGVLIFSFQHKNGEINPGLPELVERIKFFKSEAQQEVPQTVTFNFPCEDELEFVGSLLRNLAQLMSSSNALLVDNVGQELYFLSSFLRETEAFRAGNQQLQALWNRALEVAYRAEFLVDRLSLGDSSDSLSVLFHSIIEELKDIKIDVQKVSYGNREDMMEVIQTRTPSETDDFVGFHVYSESIIHFLKRGGNRLRVIPICGMPGVGKTALASKVFYDPDVSQLFEVRAWCFVSPVMDESELLKDLLRQIDSSGDIPPVDTSLLKEKGRRCRIIITSRQTNVVPDGLLAANGPHVLSKLSNKESLELLQKKLFQGKDWPRELLELGMQIMEYCQGLPLAIVDVAGHLSKSEQGRWKEILGGLSSGVIEDLRKKAWESSYEHLPYDLKPCFLYFGAFPKGQEVSVRRLFQLMMAEGLIPQRLLESTEDQVAELNSIEDFAELYMSALIERSFVQIAKQGSSGGAKTFRIHDSLHNFCLARTKKENFFHLVHGRDCLLDYNEPRYLRRLCIYDDGDASRSPSYFFHIHLGDVVPSEIGHLVQLRYLSIQGNMETIPESISNVSNLQTFVVHLEGTQVNVSLPHNLWNLKELRWLYINFGGGILPFENLEDSSILVKLESFTGDAWDMKPEDFPSLEYLKLSRLDIVKWTAHGELQFFFLMKLVLDHCSNLLELPGSLGRHALSLERIEVLSCSDISGSSVRCIHADHVATYGQQSRLTVHIQ